MLNIAIDTLEQVQQIPKCFESIGIIIVLRYYGVLFGLEIWAMNGIVKTGAR